MITIKCKNKVAEQMLMNELMKHRDVEVSVLNEAKTDKVEVYYSAKVMGQLGDIYTIDASGNVSKLAEALGIKDGWKAPVKIGGLWASLNSGDRLAFFSNKNDFHPDEE
jgi:hypothetical protein